MSHSHPHTSPSTAAPVAPVARGTGTDPARGARLRRLLSVLALLMPTAFAPLLSNCADTADCGAGQRLEDGYCVADADQGQNRAQDQEQDQGRDDAGTDASPGRPAVEEGFGDRCLDGDNHSDCTDTADYCAFAPGAEEGACTAEGCVDDALVCPEGWECFDLSAFSAGLPAICRESQP